MICSAEYFCFPITALSRCIPIYEIGSSFGGQVSTINAIFLFIDFPDDTEDPTNPIWPVGSGPSFLHDIVDSTVTQNSDIYANVTTYFKDQSNGRFNLIGKSFYIQAPESLAWYQRNHYWHEADYSAQDAINILDSRINFSEFDTWTDTGGSHILGADGIIDMIFICYRRWYISPGKINESSFRANGWYYGSIPGDIYVDGGARRITASHSLDATSMIQYPRFEHIVHEFGHAWNLDHQYAPGTWALMGERTPSTSNFINAIEREQLGWIKYKDITSTTTINLTDISSADSVCRIQIPGTSEYYILENHQKVLRYDVPDISPDGRGLYILHNAWGLTPGWDSYYVVLPADGRWEWDNSVWVDNPWETDPERIIPSFQKIGINRTSGLSKRDVFPATDPIHHNSGYFFIYAKKEYLSNQLQYGEFFKGEGKDSWNLSNNNLFSPWSNPAATQSDHSLTDIAVEVLSQNGNTLTVKVYLSDPLSAPPAKPQLVHAVHDPDSAPIITWDANQESDVTSGGGYNIYREIYYGTTIVSNTKLNSSLLTGTTYTDADNFSVTGVPNGVDLYSRYRVEAVDNTAKASMKSEGSEIYLGKTISGNIGSQTWSGQYAVVGNVTVNSGSTLTIASNSFVYFGANVTLSVYGNLSINSNAALENIASIVVQTGGTIIANSGSYLHFNSAADVTTEGAPKGSLLVYGKIHADGATFTTNTSDTSKYWAAMYIYNSRPGGDGNYIRNCDITHCKFGMVITNSEFLGASDEIYNNTITRCLNPIRLTSNSNVNRITNNTLQNNIQDGIVIYQSTASHVTGNIINKGAGTYSGRDGFWIYGSGVQPLLTNNTIQDGYDNGVRCESYAAPNFGGPYGSTNSGGWNKITDNEDYGIKAQSSTLPFLGEYEQDVCYPFAGSNSIYDNGVKQLYVATSSQIIHAKYNWWGENPDNGLGFTNSTMTRLFGTYWPLVDPALTQGEPHPLIVSSEPPVQGAQGTGLLLSMQTGGSTFQSVAYTGSVQNESSSSSKEPVVSRERILLMLADQLVLAKHYESALAVYDTLIRQYSETDEAGAALLRVNNTLSLYNTAVKSRAISGSAKSGYDYFNALLAQKAHHQFEQRIMELAALNASVEGNIAQAVTLHKLIVKQNSNSESEKHALASLVELSWNTDDVDAANGYLTTLRSKYPGDPVTELLSDMNFMVENIGMLSTLSLPNRSEANSNEEGSAKLEVKASVTYPTETALYQNYPNPFNPSTTIAYSLLAPGMVDVTVYDVLGREVAQLVHEYQSEGRKTVQFDGSRLTSNIYFVRMATQGKVFTQRMLLVK